MSAPTVDMGFDEWSAAFARVCEEHGCENLVAEAAGQALEQLFEEGRTPEEAMELLHWQ